MRRPLIKSWRRGDAITAARLDEPRKAFDEFFNRVGAVQTEQAGRIVRLMQMKVVSVGGDTITCSFYDGEFTSSAEISVARPYLLRNSLASRNGIGYTYTGTDARTADDGSDTEDQVVVPAYVAGDIIYAMSIPSGGTSVENAEWIDINVDGRAWAKAAA